MLKPFLPVIQLWCLAYYRLALRQINPMHKDVGLIVQRIVFWESVR